MSAPMRVIALGVHVVDVLVRPVEVIPEAQGGCPVGLMPRGARAALTLDTVPPITTRRCDDERS